MLYRFPFWLGLCMVAAGCSTSRPDESGPKAHETSLSRRLSSSAAAAPLVIAHRGDSSRFPENTLAAFRAANELGVDLIEFDVRQSQDGVLVCLHDEFVDRTTDSAQRFGRDRVAVGSLTADQLQELDAGSWKGSQHAGEGLPRLGTALPLIADDSVPMIERKDGDAGRYVTLIRDLGLAHDVVVTSFDWTWLAEMRSAAPELTLGAIGEGELNGDRIAKIDALGVSVVHWNHRDLSIDALAELRARGYLVCVYTIDDELGMVGTARAGVDAITTNRPASLIRLRADGHARR